VAATGWGRMQESSRMQESNFRAVP
jgi:hypothetical protein